MRRWAIAVVLGALVSLAGPAGAQEWIPVATLVLVDDAGSAQRPNVTRAGASASLLLDQLPRGCGIYLLVPACPRQATR